MASAAQSPGKTSESGSQKQQAGISGLLNGVKQRLQTPIQFWTKLSNDWVFNLSALLAYNLLMSAFPILLVLLAIGGFLLGNISPGSQQQIQNSIASAIPGGSALFTQVLNNLNKSAGALLVLGVVLALFTGSRLFITIENCFGIVYRLRGRDPIHQNIMAIGMLLLYAILIPIILLASVIPPAIINALPVGQSSPVISWLIQAGFVATSVVVAFILFAVTYIVVPNRPVRLNEVWKGILVASVLLVLYEALFPYYVHNILHASSYGSTAGFAVVILLFFYYFGFILLLGAEVNSWALGQRQTAGPINAILHEVQAHNTTVGAAGPTAGSPQEDIQSGKGAAAMDTYEHALEHERSDHSSDAIPSTEALSIEPPPTEAPPAREGQQNESHARPAGEAPTIMPLSSTGLLEPGLATSYTGPEDHDVFEAESAIPAQSLSARQRAALVATTTAGALATLPVIGLMLRTFYDEQRCSH
jgi:YihY family inner membrane protein